MPGVVLEGVTKVYPDGTEAVSGLDLEVPDGSLCVLLGPSGCGKTTVLRLVAGLERLTEGTIRIGDRDVSEDAPKDRDVAMVFQNYALYPHLTVYDNIAFGLQLRRVRKAEVDSRVRRAAAVLGLEDVLRRRPRTLSGGQRQRAAMGRAIVREPQVFLMDEPLSNLDARLRGDMRAEIARIQRDVGVTTLYVTHDQMEAMTLGDRVAVLRDGLLQQVGTPADLYDRPASLFVAGFIGSPPTNLVEATLERSGAGLAVGFGSHRLALDVGAFGDAAAWLGDASRRQVILGIRPEHLQDAALASDASPDRRIRAVVDRRELLGPEVYLRFIVDAPLLLVRDPREQEDPDDALTAWAAERANAFTARVDPRTGAREGDAIELAVDTERVHLFDPETGASLR